MESENHFDATRAWLRGADFFPRFIVTDGGHPLGNEALGDDVELLVGERNGEKRAFVSRELAHPHVVQGTLGGEPFLVSFWGVCNSGVGLTPTVDGTTHHFSAGGLYNGLVLLFDDESESYWDHITGVAVHGPLTGRSLDVWPLEYTTVGAALASDPELAVSRQRRRGLKARFMAFMHRKKIGTRGFLPPPFRQTMGEADSRLPEMEQGLGIVVDDTGRFYPTRALSDPARETIGDRNLTVQLDPETRVPTARWSDGSQPFQLFTRWYGFSFTFPGSSIYSPPNAGAASQSKQ